jgi:hypothetical protein
MKNWLLAKHGRAIVSANGPPQWEGTGITSFDPAAVVAVIEEDILPSCCVVCLRNGTKLSVNITRDEMIADIQSALP